MLSFSVLQIPQGQQIAIVGAGDCGKSTLIKLICRFYFPDKGSLKLFGVESVAWAPDALRENFSIVTQDPALFDGSFFENGSYGRPGATREEYEAALKGVSLWDFVCGFPEGMDHQIGESGQTLSGGQNRGGRKLPGADGTGRKVPGIVRKPAERGAGIGKEAENQSLYDLQKTIAIVR